MLKNNMLRIVAISAAALFPVAANASNTVLVCTVKASDFQKSYAYDLTPGGVISFDSGDLQTAGDKYIGRGLFNSQTSTYQSDISIEIDRGTGQFNIQQRQGMAVELVPGRTAYIHATGICKPKKMAM
ncbi:MULTISPECIES: hypothetical protein [Burkholderiaceae]|uniref:hypothetical protein n=1 Tax=Burkholderiaceae TaxID=119060 RepID=UPI00119876B4|nr:MULTISPECIES: hypothetical protein [Burkholderiaceae]MBN3532591.1 hypothetical protein [Burkholderia cenocepacia]QDX23521.1 hypothetical protein FP568_21440 [Pandoraea pnomenusa]QGR93530.1 hypothetical protein FOC30_21815 [Burkholderia multivorans]